MVNYYWNNWYTGFGWLLWFGLMILFVSGIGNWGYTYGAHRRFASVGQPKSAADILDERYARGEITHEEYSAMKANIGVGHPTLRHA